jgi:hypothetical protein
MAKKPWHWFMSITVLLLSKSVVAETRAPIPKLNMNRGPASIFRLADAEPPRLQLVENRALFAHDDASGTLNGSRIHWDDALYSKPQVIRARSGNFCLGVGLGRLCN